MPHTTKRLSTILVSPYGERIAKKLGKVNQIIFDSGLGSFEFNSNPIQINKAADPNPIRIFIQIQLDKLTQLSLNKIISN